jgi:tRNA 2-thiocytidine biosynthesis protein TtcA
LGSKIRKLMTKASTEFDMIKEGDRVLVGLSGGKDSLTMLVLLLDLQRRAPFKFSVAACTVEPGAAEFDPSPLKAYVTPQLGIPYFFESDTIIQRAKGVGGKFSICAYCARQKRGILYSTALREGYNVLALAQHTDDLAESFLMSAMHNGRLRTMKVTARCLIRPRCWCCYAIEINVVTGQLHQRQGRARHPSSYVRRLTLCCNHCAAAPFDFICSYVREMMTRAYADASLLPVIEDNCPACFKVNFITRCCGGKLIAFCRRLKSASASNFSLRHKSNCFRTFTAICCRRVQSFGDVRRVGRDVTPCSAGYASAHEPIHKRRRRRMK